MHRDRDVRSIDHRNGQNLAGHPIQVIGIGGGHLDVEVWRPGEPDDFHHFGHGVISHSLDPEMPRI